MHLSFHKVNLATFCVLSLLLAMMSSCSVLKRTRVRNEPINKPFVFANKISLKGNIAKDEKIRLTNELDNYWDDSLKVRMVQQFGIFSFLTMGNMEIYMYRNSHYGLDQIICQILFLYRVPTQVTSFLQPLFFSLPLTL